MRKIPTMFIRDSDNPKRVTTTVDPDCQWVANREGVATEKFDGSACLIHEGEFYRRHNLKLGREAPSGWVHWSFEPEAESGHGWALVDQGTADQYHREAWHTNPFVDGTYELVGPSLRKNPYRLEQHEIWLHGSVELRAVPRTYAGLNLWLDAFQPMEGIVFHHPDGRMAKIKRRDFGLPWPVK